ncbi:cadherin-like domain-containing protein [Catenovulum adriaticum]|uniref:Ig-like domain-containing protein n=1 Tax=Catenovulum adriaticum TaxID=2984846 RepID=A0ABY7ASZ1_9ALTE|nr:cadherin-like domain-containing protein [Catenovulum sp. TS8]WAJ71411.1 Ig-like domain-containing protein [Catenovulum sp. TS8]
MKTFTHIHKPNLVAKAALPVLAMASPYGFAENSYTSSLLTLSGSVSVYNQTQAFKQATANLNVDIETPFKPFMASELAKTKVQIAKQTNPTATPTHSAIEFLKQNGLLNSGNKQVASVSGDLEARKNFAGYTGQPHCHYNGWIAYHYLQMTCTTNSGTWHGANSPADTTPPTFDSSTPSENAINHNQAVFNLDINEGGKVYAIVVADDAFAPNAAQVKAGVDYDMGSGRSAEVISSANVTLNSGNYTGTITLTGLTASTAYDVYFIAEDDEGTPNLQSTPTKLDITTIAAPNTVPVFANLDGSSSYTEGGSAVVLDNNVTISDTELDALDSGTGNYNNASLTIVRNGGANSEDIFANSGLLGALTQSNSFSYNGSNVGTVTTNSSGTLVLTFNSNATSAIVDSVLQNITYSNSSDNPASSVALNYTFNDGLASSNGINQAVVTIAAVNDNPTMASLPSGLSFTEDTNGNLDLSAVEFADTDNGTITVTLKIDGGSFATPADGSSVIETLVDSSTITLTGSPADINAYLDTVSNIKYTGANNAYGENSAKLTVIANDGNADVTLGFTYFDIAAVNDTPVVSNNNGLTLNEGASSQISNTALAASDVDDAATDITFTITTLPANGSLFIDANSNSSLDDGEALALNGTLTQNDIDAANNGGLHYVHNGGETTTDSFEFSVADGGEDSAAAVTGQTFNITVTPINDAPTVANNAGLTINEGANSQITTTELNASDADDSGTGLTYTVTTIPTNGTLFVDANSNSTLDDGEALSVNDTFTQQDIEALNNGGLRYEHDGGETISDSFEFDLADGGEDSAAAVTGQTFAITINPVNDAPTANTNTGLSTSDISEGGSATLAQAKLEYTDVDDTAANLTYTVTTLPSYGSITLNDTALAVNETFTQDDINNGLVKYVHNGTDNLTDSFIFDLKDDEDAGVTGQTFSINVANVNDNTTVASLPTDSNFTEDTNGNLDLSAITFSDSDSANITVTLSISAGVFSTPADGSGVGSGVTETLVNSTTITLVGSVADINTYLDTTTNINYTGAANVAGDNQATLSVSVNDGDGSGDVSVGSINIDLTAVNDAPTVSTNSGLTLNEGASSQISNTVLAASDVDDAATDITFTITTLPANGSLFIDANSNSSLDDGEALALNGTLTQNDIDAANNGGLHYVHNGGETTTDSFEFSVADGGEDSAAAVTGQTFNITVTPINDAPTVANNAGLTLNEGANGQITTTELNASDADDSGTGLTYTVTTVPSSGTLFVDANSNSTLDDGEALSVNDTFTQQDIEALNNGGLRYEHDGGETTSDSFEFDLADGGEDSVAAVTGQTFAITINPVNDAPTANTNTGLSTSDISEGGSASITQAKLEYTDVDTTDTATNLTYTVTTLPSYGSITLNDTALAVNETFTQDDINNGLVKYVHNGTDNLTDSFIFDLKDDENAGVTGQTFSINVANVNDNPTVASLPSGLSFTEDTNGNLDLSAVEFADTDNGTITVTLKIDGGSFATPADGSSVIETLVDSSTITLTGSPADINAYLDTVSNIKYTGANNAYGENSAMLTVIANDGNADVTLGFTYFNIAAVNDTPVVSNNNGLTLNEGASSQISNTALAASDVDDATSALTYTVSTLPTNGTLFVDNNANDTLDDGEALSVPSNASFTQTTIDSDDLHYVHNGGETTSDSFVFKVSDDENATVSGQTFAITVTPVNDQPTVTATSINPTFNEGGSAVNVFSSADVSTIDASEAVTGFSLTVSNVNDGANEKITIAGTAIALTHGTSGTTASNSLNYAVDVSGSTATVTLTGGSLTDAATESVLNAIQYNNTKVQPNVSARVVTLTSLKDNGGTANGGDDTAELSIASTVSVAIKPVINAANISISGGTGTDGAFKLGDTVTVRWNNTGAGDNNSGVTGVTADFSNFGGSSAVAATESAGTWTASYTIVAGVIDAINQNVSISVTNSIGSRTSSDTSNVTVDNSAPTVSDSNISISGASGNDGSYKIGDKVTATWNNTAGGDNNSDTINNVAIDFSQFGGGSAVLASDSSGTWTATYTIVAGSIDANNRNISVTATDNSGNSTTTADSTNASIDNTVPDLVTITTPIETDGVINAAEDNDVLIQGTGGENNATVTVNITDNNSSVSRTVTTDSSGNWTIAGSEIDVSAFNNGSLTVSATQTDDAGNTSTVATQTITLDNTAPSAPVITTPIETDGIVNAAEDNDVLIQGTGGENNATVTVNITGNNSSVSRTVTTDGSGNWSIAGSEIDVSAFNNGSLTVSATQTDEVGNTSTAATQSIMLDNAAPTAPSISTPIEIDNIVNANEDDSVLISGSGAEANASLTITIGSVSIQTTADTNGNWTIESKEIDISALTNGTLTVAVTQTDDAGNESSSATQDITLDNAAPSAPVITTPIETDGIVNAAEDNDVLIAGSGAEADNSVTVTITDNNNSTVSSTVTADGSGNWTLSGSELDVSAFNNATLTVSATQTDEAGNTSTAATQNITLDNQAPSALTITTPIEGDGYINAAEDNDVLITGSGAEANVTVDIKISDGSNTETAQVTADGSGNWTIAGSEIDVSAFNNGSLTVSATQTDDAGNTSTVATQTITLDNTAPSAPVITTPIETDGIVNAAEDNDVLIQGTGGENNATVTVNITDNNSSVSRTVTTDGSGNWTLAGSEIDVSTFNNDSLTVSATQTDEAGNTSTAATQSIMLDNAAPTAPSISTPIEIDNIVNANEDDSVLISGSGAEANASLTITIGSVSIQTTADTNGNWTIESKEIDISALTNGTLTVAVTQTDDAGNESSSATQDITLDNAAPSAPVITTPIAADDVVNAAEASQLILTGSSEANALVKLTVTDENNASVTMQTTANSQGEWTTAQTDLSALSDGILMINIAQTDEAGNTSTENNTQVTKDTQIPGVLDIQLMEGDFKAGDTLSFSVTLDKAVSVSGTNSTLSVDIGGEDKQAKFISATQTALNYQYIVEAGDADDDGVVVLASGVVLNGDVIEDSSGNPADLTFTNEQNTATLVDTSAPEQPLISYPEQATVINADSIQITGTHSEGIQVKLFIDENNDGQPDTSEAIAVADVVNDEWAFDITLSENTVHRYVVQAIDKAGNVSSFATVPNITEDSTTPADFDVNIEQSLIDLSNDTSASVSLSGAEVGSQYQYTITDSNNQAVTGTGIVTDSNQLIEGIDVKGLAEGELTISIVLIDAANNQSQRFTDTVNKLYQKAPVITQGDAIQVDMSEDSVPTAFGLLLNATDANGDSLSWSVSTDANSGTALINGTGDTASVNYTPQTNFNGSDSFTIQVSDGMDSDSITVNVNVSAVNDAPTGTNMQVNVIEDGTVLIMPDINDVDGDMLSLEIQQPPQNGLLIPQDSGWQYQPNLNFNGSDRFVYVVTDGSAESVEYTVDLTVTAVNDLPVAQADSFNLEKAVSDSYTLNVLSNDSDIDGDTLIIEGVSASVGQATINENQDSIIYQAPDNFTGNVTLAYSVRDGNKGRSQAQVKLQITGVQLGEPPVISVPDDVEVNATGLFTKVDLGVATAVDALGNPLPVSLVDGTTYFKPGNHIAYWRAVDAQGNESTVEQAVVVNPLISISKDQVVSEGSTVTVNFLLNGPAPQYPLTIPFNVDDNSTAEAGVDYELNQTSVDILSGTQAQLSFKLLSDSEIEADESIIINLGEGLNTGAKKSTRLLISEDNIAPTADLTVEQDGEERLIVSQETGLVNVTAKVTDPNPSDTMTFSWSTNDDIVNLSSESDRFEFDPLLLNPGVYPISLTVTDSGSPQLSDMQTVYIEVRNSLQLLSAEIDSDGDLIPDAEEGFADTDGDGIPDYQDAISDCNVMPEQLDVQQGFLVEGDPGVCLRKGATSALSNTGGLLLDDEQILNDLVTDNEATIVGGLIDFIAYGLPEKGQSYQLVVPQAMPIPESAVYRKIIDGTWVNFVEDERNQISSALGEAGVCPPPGDDAWIAGLTEGHWCVQLTIEDGGPNDDDGMANGSITDPGGIAVIASNNSSPVAMDDIAELAWNTSVTIDVLNNDTDVDGDDIQISSVSASFGSVLIEANHQITYSPNPNYAGNDTIEYGITDGNGGTGSAKVSVTVKPNRAPIAENDTLTIDGSRSVQINVLSNDSDIDGDSLQIDSASAQSGEVAIVNNTITYTAGEFIGEDTIDYVINDGEGGQANASVTVTVTGPEQVKISNKSSGGSTGIWSLFGLLAGALTRYRQKRAVAPQKGQK